MKKLLEIVISTKEEAIIAESAGANRIEVSVNHERRGTTQDMENISGIVALTTIPTYVLIKPNQFTYEYSEEEFAKILHIIEICKISNVKGITVGFLKEGKIDRERLDKVLSIRGDLEVNFNRAIDSVIDYEGEIKYLDQLEGISFIHTSGQSETVIDGRARLKQASEWTDKLIFSGALNIDGINILDDYDLTSKVYQVNSGARSDYNYKNIISYDLIKDLRKRLDK